jgi:hypothetical protein
MQESAYTWLLGVVLSVTQNTADSINAQRHDINNSLRELRGFLIFVFTTILIFYQ